MHAFHRALSGLAIVAALAGASLAHAQSAPAAPIDAEKQKLIDQILTLYPFESQAIMHVQSPAKDILEHSGIALQARQLTKDKIDKTMKDISVDVQKYVDAVNPIATTSAKKNVGPAVGPMLAQNFSADELKQLIAMLGSPVRGKFEKLVPQMERAVDQKVQADIGPQVNKDVQAMTAAVVPKLQAASTN